MDAFSFQSCNVVGSGGNVYSVNLIKAVANGNTNSYPEVGDEIRQSGTLAFGAGYFGYVDTSQTLGAGPQNVYVLVDANGVIDQAMKLCSGITPTPSVTKSPSRTPSKTPSRTPSISISRTPSRTPSNSPITTTNLFSAQSEGFGASNASTACNAITANVSFFVNNGQTTVSQIVQDDYIYKNAAATQVWQGNNFYYGIHDDGAFSPTYVMRVDNNGKVLSNVECASNPSPTPTRTPSTTPASGNSLSLGYSATSATDACNNTFNTYYSTCNNLGNGCTIFINSGLSKHAPAGYYSDGSSSGFKPATGGVNLSELCFNF